MRVSNVSIVIAALGLCFTVLSFFVGRQSAAKTEGKEAGSLSTDLKYIKSSVERIENRLNDDVKRLEGRIDEQSQLVLSLGQEAARAHESAKSAHKRIDEHLEREHGMTIVRHTENS